MGMTPKFPQPQPLPPPPPLPIDPGVLERRRRSLQKAKSGRLSTVLAGARGLTNRGTISAPSLTGGTTGLSAGR